MVGEGGGERLQVPHVVEDVMAHHHVRRPHLVGRLRPPPLHRPGGDAGGAGGFFEAAQHVVALVHAGDEPGAGNEAEAGRPPSHAHVYHRPTVR